MDQYPNSNSNPYQSESREFIWYNIDNKVRKMAKELLQPTLLK